MAVSWPGWVSTTDPVQAFIGLTRAQASRMSLAPDAPPPTTRPSRPKLPGASPPPALDFRVTPVPVRPDGSKPPGSLGLQMKIGGIMQRAVSSSAIAEVTGATESTAPTTEANERLTVRGSTLTSQ